MKKGAKTKTKKITKKTEEKPVKKKAVKKETSIKKKTVKKVKRVKSPTKKELKIEQEQHIEDIKHEIERTIKVERDKKMILWSGVTFFMAVIFVFWIFNIKSTLKNIEVDSVGQKKVEWSEISDNIDNAMNEMKENLAEIKEFTENTKEVSTSTDENIGKVVNDIFSEEDEMTELRARLKDLEARLATSSSDKGLE